MTKVLESAKLRGLFEELMQDYKTPLQFKQIIQSFFFDDDVRVNYLRNVLEAEREGKDLNQDSNWIMEFEIEARRQFDLKFSSIDPLSLLGSLNFKKADERFLSWGLFNTNVLLKVAGGGVFSSLTGVPGSGKTDFALKLAQIAANNNKRVITNIMINDPSGRIIAVNRVSEYLKRVVEFSKQNLDTILIIDEAGLTWGKKDAMMRRNRAWEKLARILRKLDCNLIFVVQERFGVPPLINEFKSVAIHKYSKKRCKFEYNNGGGSFHCYIGNIPSTDIKFETKDLAFFSFDLNLDKLLEYIADSTNLAMQHKKILKFIKISRSRSNQNRNRDNNRLERQIVNYRNEHPRATQRQIADILGCSQSRVSQILTENNLS